MTRGVIAVRADTPLAEVAASLGRHRISGAPVVDEHGRVAGVISEKDFLPLMGAERGDSFMTVVAGCLKGKGCPAVSAREQTAAELMSAPAVTVFEEATVSGDLGPDGAEGDQPPAGDRCRGAAGGHRHPRGPGPFLLCGGVLRH